MGLCQHNKEKKHRSGLAQEIKETGNDWIMQKHFTALPQFDLSLSSVLNEIRCSLVFYLCGMILFEADVGKQRLGLFLFVSL